MIRFFVEDIKFNVTEKIKLKKWLNQIAILENFMIIEINYIFCSDEYLLQINKEYLQHNDLTDVITFDQSEITNEIEGDIYISIERVQDNAKNLGFTFQDELKRVIAHGLLHLIGYRDKTTNDILIMRQKEDFYLNLWNN
jgi:probable rRNA maturation factor